MMCSQCSAVLGDIAFSLKLTTHICGFSSSADTLYEGVTLPLRSERTALRITSVESTNMATAISAGTTGETVEPPLPLLGCDGLLEEGSPSLVRTASRAPYTRG